MDSSTTTSSCQSDGTWSSLTYTCPTVGMTPWPVIAPQQPPTAMPTRNDECVAIMSHATYDGVITQYGHRAGKSWIFVPASNCAGIDVQFVGPSVRIQNVKVRKCKNGDKVKIRQPGRFTKKICGSWDPQALPDNKRTTTNNADNVLINFSSNGNRKATGFMIHVCSHTCT